MTVLAKNVLIRFSCQVTVDLTHSQKQALFKRMRTSNQKLLLIFLNFHLIRIRDSLFAPGSEKEILDF